MKEGWIRIHRQIFDWPLYFKEKFTYTQAWLDLLLLANFKESVFVVHGVHIKVGRGQLAWSQERLASRWMWSRAKVQRYTKLLENEHQIVQQKIHDIITLITIVNYEGFQGNDTANSTAKKDPTIQQTVQQTVQQTLHIIRNNKKEEEKNNAFEKFWELYPNKKAKPKAYSIFRSLSVLELDGISAALPKHIESEQWKKENGKYIPYPATWLNQRRWEDKMDEDVGNDNWEKMKSEAEKPIIPFDPTK